MKHLVFLLLVIIFLGSCSERKNRIEIIKDYDNIYLAEDLVDTGAKFPDKSDELTDAVKKILLELHGNKQKKTFYPISYKVYINENGKIEKIMDYSQYMIDYLMASKIEKSSQLTSENIYKDIDKLTKKLLPEFEKINFTPALLDGRSVSSRTKLKAIGIVDEKGGVELGIDFNFNFDLKFGGNILDRSEYSSKVDEMPTPVGGIMAIQKKIKYPEIAKQAGIQGRVYVKALIDENGDVRDIEILKGLEGGCNSAAAEAVKNTKFHPGREKGKPVKVQVSIPIMFKLN